MTNKAVELNVAGQSCRVVTTADQSELQALAAMVEEKLAAVLQPGRPVDTRSMLLAAVALANDAREQKRRADAIAARAKTALQGLMTRVDDALEHTDRLAAARIAPSKKKSKRVADHDDTGDDDEA
jgi:cell division protein ZapA